MVYVLGILQFLLIGYIFLFELKNKSAVSFLWATLLIMFGVMHLLASFTGDAEYSDAILCEASVFVILFCLLYLSVRIVLGINLRKIQTEKLTYAAMQSGLEGIGNLGVWFLILIAVIGLKLVLYVRSVGGLLNTSWSAQRTYQGSLSYLNPTQILSVLLCALSGLIVIFWVKKKYLFAVFSVLALLVDVMFMRQRADILPLLGAIITAYLLYLKKIQAKTIVLIVIAAVAVIFVVYGIRVIRYYGTIQELINNFTWGSFFSQMREFFATDNGELGLRRYFYYFISEGNNFEGFGEGATYIRMLMVFVPTRWSLGLKPADFAQTMGAAVGMAAGGSMHPTLFGDCYANLGIFGIFLGAFWAALATLSDKIMFSIKNSFTSILLFVLWASEFCIIGRGSVYNGFWLIAWGTLLLLVANLILSKAHIPQIVIHTKRKHFRIMHGSRTS